MVISGGFVPVDLGGPAPQDDGGLVAGGLPSADAGPASVGAVNELDVDNDVRYYDSYDRVPPEMGEWALPDDGMPPTSAFDGNDARWVSPGDQFSGSDNGNSGGDFDLEVNYRVMPEGDTYTGVSSGPADFGTNVGDFGFGDPSSGGSSGSFGDGGSSGGGGAMGDGGGGGGEAES